LTALQPSIGLARLWTTVGLCGGAWQ